MGWRIETPFGEASGDTPDQTVKDVVSTVSNGTNSLLSSAGNNINSALDASNWEDVYLQIISGGILGVGRDGNIGMGVTTRGVRDAVRDVTGANALDEANNRARQLIADQRAEAARLREEEIARMRRSEVAASRAAGQAQQLGFLGGSGSGGSDSSSFNNLTRDFLGL